MEFKLCLMGKILIDCVEEVDFDVISVRDFGEGARIPKGCYNH